MSNQVTKRLRAPQLGYCKRRQDRRLLAYRVSSTEPGKGPVQVDPARLLAIHDTVDVLTGLAQHLACHACSGVVVGKGARKPRRLQISVADTAHGGQKLAF